MEAKPRKAGESITQLRQPTSRAWESDPSIRCSASSRPCNNTFQPVLEHLDKRTPLKRSCYLHLIMEALAVLGLVANIVQLLDAAGNPSTVCREIYTLGRSIEDTSMAFASEQLHEPYRDLARV